MPKSRHRFFALDIDRFRIRRPGDALAESESASAPDDSPGDDPAGKLTTEPDEADPASSDAPDALAPGFQRRRPRRVEVRHRSRGWLLAVALISLIAGVLLGAHLPRRAEVSGPTSALRPSAKLTPADDTDLDAAFRARRERRFEEAERLFADLERRHPEWGAIDVERARTLILDSKPHDAMLALDTASERGLAPAEACFLRARLYNSRRTYAEAERNFAAAVALDPTVAEYYFHWGECLRDQGKLLDAAAKYRSAALRNDNAAAGGLYVLKFWLSSIEAGQAQANEAGSQIEGALAKPHPPMEALVAAAARDLAAGNTDAAVGKLARARRRADPDVFRYVMGDPLFAPLRTRAEFADVFQQNPTPPPAAPAPPDGKSVSPAPAVSGPAGKH